MKTIPLSKGKVAIVDDEWFERLSKYNWSASYRKHCDIWYATAHVLCPDGKKRQVYMHRFILGAKRGQKVDHEDHDGLDNVTSNIRICTFRNNNRNKRKLQIASSRFKGVIWHSRDESWVALIGIGQLSKSGKRKRKWLGYFESEEAAARAYDDAARMYFGEFAALNFPEPGEQAAAA